MSGFHPESRNYLIAPLEFEQKQQNAVSTNDRYMLRWILLDRNLFQQAYALTPNERIWVPLDGGKFPGNSCEGGLKNGDNVQKKCSQGV